MHLCKFQKQSVPIEVYFPFLFLCVVTVEVFRSSSSQTHVTLTMWLATCIIKVSHINQTTERLSHYVIKICYNINIVIIYYNIKTSDKLSQYFLVLIYKNSHFTMYTINIDLKIIDVNNIIILVCYC